jgi:coproporphyrinogen III oxidase-like Fe-S oxidoreductase
MSSPMSHTGEPLASPAPDPPPPLALYLHFPWCVRKCPYCDFNSHELKDPLPEERYIDTLLADVAVQAPRATGREVVSLFLGGGTPACSRPPRWRDCSTGCAGIWPSRTMPR